MQWSNQTVQKALKLKFACGTTGYETLQELGYPLPSIRTLQNRMKEINFTPGILHTVFELLKLKVSRKVNKNSNIII